MRVCEGILAPARLPSWPRRSSLVERFPGRFSGLENNTCGSATRASGRPNRRLVRPHHRL